MYTSVIMAVIVHVALLLFMLFIYLAQIRACELVPSNDGSCFELKATEHLTYDSTGFGPRIEGPSVNPAGDMFAVDYGDENTKYQLGQITPTQRLFYRDTNEASYFSGMKFLNSETALIVDAINHRILKLNVAFGNFVSSSENYCSNSSMLQPNDLTISKTGIAFASGFSSKNDSDGTDGDIWTCLRDGTAKRLELLSRTNGIELSPDDRYLYVTEAYRTGGIAHSQVIWRYNADVTEGSISNKILFVNVSSLGDTVFREIDGIKVDILGNLFVTRHGGSRIEVFSPEGNLIGKIGLNFRRPTNLEFGGPSGRTLYIVGQCEPEGKGCVDRIEVVTPGRSWAILQESNASSIYLSKFMFLLMLCIFYTTFSV